MEAASALLTAHEGNAAMTQGHSLKRNIFLRELEKRRAAAAPGRNDKVGDDPDSDDGEWLYGSEARDNEIHAAAAAEGARQRDPRGGSGRGRARLRGESGRGGQGGRGARVGVAHATFLRRTSPSAHDKGAATQGPRGDAPGFPAAHGG